LKTFERLVFRQFFTGFLPRSTQTLQQFFDHKTTFEQHGSHTLFPDSDWLDSYIAEENIRGSKLSLHSAAPTKLRKRSSPNSKVVAGKSDALLHARRTSRLNLVRRCGGHSIRWEGGRHNISGNLLVSCLSAGIGYDIGAG
jgi:hypothetical protein